MIDEITIQKKKIKEIESDIEHYEMVYSNLGDIFRLFKDKQGNSFRKETVEVIFITNNPKEKKKAKKTVKKMLLALNKEKQKEKKKAKKERKEQNLNRDKAKLKTEIEKKEARIELLKDGSSVAFDR